LSHSLSASVHDIKPRVSDLIDCRPRYLLSIAGICHVNIIINIAVDAAHLVILAWRVAWPS